MHPWTAILVIGALSSACTVKTADTATDSSTGETTAATTGTATTAATTGAPTSTGDATTGPDPGYLRDCQAGDFVCDDWGCVREPEVRDGECYKRCTPSGGIGELDAECDEPERPFCSQTGRALGGDFDCNACAHICVSATFNACQNSVDQCD